MTKRQFRLILLTYVLGVLGAWVVHHYTHNFGVPVEVVKAANIARYDFSDLTLLLVSGGEVAIIILLIIGIVGLLISWRPARHFMLAAYVAYFLLKVLTPAWGVVTNWEGVVGTVDYMLGAVILTICYSPLGTQLFTPQKSRRNGLLIVLLLILAVVGAVAVTYWQCHRPGSYSDEDRVGWWKVEQPFESARADVEESLKAYKAEHGNFPASLADLQLTNFPSGVSTSYLACFKYSVHQQGYRLSMSVGGIGIQLRSHGDIHGIESVLPGGAASKTNLAAGDYILKVDGNDVSQASYYEFLSVLRGPPGTTVALTVRRKGTGSIETVTLTREPLP